MHTRHKNEKKKGETKVTWFPLQLLVKSELALYGGVNFIFDAVRLEPNLTNRCNVAVHLFSKMTSNCDENKQVAHEPQA